ncbi:polysaccharide biosynthesis/export family protein [Chitinophaga sp. CF418]|uniref:polysaccharide biosynthesis/export family protein n=1 Tax=Chitinophaga sp. CF418 TaxID=1855287 RepID=UPI00091FCB09|nr:polysaccharide biosynthesis/export family protein [Chitinophaga sp. CF418]SHN28222.1 polysaccharide export outer membrane protein [Chitinophaga sp. CF418]
MRIINRGSRTTKPGVYLLLLMAGAMSLYFTSCSSPKNIAYFKDIPDSVRKTAIDQATFYTPPIQPDDILQVSIQTLDPSATALLNQQNTATWPIDGSPLSPGSATGTGSSNSSISGYLVDKDGYVVLPLIGKVFVKGKTTDVVRDEVRGKAAEYYKDPVVNVRFVNFKITVLGEVTKPSSYIMPNEKVTLLDALGMAGDLTIYGRRENILLIRDAGVKKEFIRFNLNDSKMFTSPYFYLRQGDVIYVEPNKTKVESTDVAKTRNFTIAVSLLSLIVVLATRLKL